MGAPFRSARMTTIGSGQVHKPFVMPIPPRAVDRVIGGTPTLGSDQAAAVRTLAGTNDGVSVLVGPAGTGKTYTLDTIRAVYETAGYLVQGAAPSGSRTACATFSV